MRVLKCGAGVYQNQDIAAALQEAAAGSQDTALADQDTGVAMQDTCNARVILTKHPIFG